MRHVAGRYLSRCTRCIPPLPSVAEVGHEHARVATVASGGWREGRAHGGAWDGGAQSTGWRVAFCTRAHVCVCGCGCCGLLAPCGSCGCVPMGTRESGEARGPRVCCDGETEMQSGVMRSGVVWVEGGGESRDSLPSQRRGAQSSAAFACVVSARASPWERAVRYPRVPE